MSKNTKGGTSSPETTASGSPELPHTRSRWDSSSPSSQARPVSPWKSRVDNASRGSSFDLAAPKIIGSVASFSVGDTDTEGDELRLLLDADGIRHDNRASEGSGFGVNFLSEASSGSEAATASAESTPQLRYFAGVSGFLSRDTASSAATEEHPHAAPFKRELSNGTQVMVLNIKLAGDDENKARLFANAVETLANVFAKAITIVGAPDELSSLKSEKHYRVVDIRFNFIFESRKALEDFKINFLLDSEVFTDLEKENSAAKDFAKYARSVLTESRLISEANFSESKIQGQENFCTIEGKQPDEATAKNANSALFEAVKASKTVCDLSLTTASSPSVAGLIGKGVFPGAGVTEHSRGRSRNRSGFDSLGNDASPRRGSSLSRVANAARGLLERARSLSRGRNRKDSDAAGPQDLKRFRK